MDNSGKNLDVVIINMLERFCEIFDTVISTNYRIKVTESEMLDKYLDLAREKTKYDNFTHHHWRFRIVHKIFANKFIFLWRLDFPKIWNSQEAKSVCKLHREKFQAMVEIKEKATVVPKRTLQIVWIGGMNVGINTWRMKGSNSKRIKVILL